MDLKRRLLCALMVLGCLSAMAENKARTVYLYGFAASFNDSTVYFTGVQKLDSAYLDTKTKFLYSRENYSYQLRDYLAGIGFSNATCITSFAGTPKEAEKKYQALRKKYTGKGNYVIKDIKEAEFSFKPISPNQ